MEVITLGLEERRTLEDVRRDATLKTTVWVSPTIVILTPTTVPSTPSLVSDKEEIGEDGILTNVLMTLLILVMMKITMW